MVHNAIGEANVRDFAKDEATLDVVFSSSKFSPGLVDFGPNWVRLAPNETNPGLSDPILVYLAQQAI